MLPPLLLGSLDAEAQTSSLEGFGVGARSPVFGTQKSQASAAELSEAVGSPTYQVTCPPGDRTNVPAGDRAIVDHRTVRVDLSKPGLRYREFEILSPILDAALRRAWAECPITMDANGEVQSVPKVDVYGQPSDGAPEMLLVSATDYSGGYWGPVRDMYEREEKAAGVAAQQVAAAAQAQAADQAEAARQVAAFEVQRVRAQAARDDREKSKVTLFWLALGGLALWAYRKRETLLYWYYSLTPHPAHSLVQARVEGGGPLDGPLFAEIMSPMPGSSIEQRVRADQAKELASLARAAGEKRLKELERLRAKALEEAAYIRAQVELRDAVRAHEAAAAGVAAVRDWRARYGK